MDTFKIKKNLKWSKWQYFKWLIIKTLILSECYYVTEIVIDGDLSIKYKEDFFSPVADLIVLFTFLVCFYYVNFVARTESPNNYECHKTRFNAFFLR